MNIFLDISFLFIFGLFALCVKPVRVTSCVVLITAIVNLLMLDSYNMLAARGETTGLLIMASIDMLAAVAMMIFYFGSGDNTKKAPHQALVFTLFALSHGWLAFELAVKQYYFYEVYDYALWGLTLAHILVMGGYYEELKRNSMDMVADRLGFGGRIKPRVADRILRNHGMGNHIGRNNNGGLGSNKGNHGRKQNRQKSATL